MINDKYYAEEACLNDDKQIIIFFKITICEDKSKTRSNCIGGNLKESKITIKPLNKKKSNVQQHLSSVHRDHRVHLRVSYGPQNKQRSNAQKAATGSFL